MEIEQRIQLVEQGLLTKVRASNRPPRRRGLAERMAHYIVPGVSIAVVDGGGIAWARGYGLAEAGRPDPVTPQTLFQAASISKPVSALAALRLVQAGLLDLDADVNGGLRSWQVPPHAWTGTEPVTLRRLLSHSAGLTVPGFPGYAQGAALPTLVQVLDGAPPANTAPIRVTRQPGLAYEYSGGGYAVLQQLLEDVAGQPFADLLQETVLRPAGMADSAFTPPAAGAAAATAHRPDGSAVPGRWHTYPELAAAGLWTTPSDLARFALALQAAWAGAPGAILSQTLAREMLRPQLEDMGLGPIVVEDGERLIFGHGGSNEGYRCMFWHVPNSGQGVAVMTNSDNGWALAGEIVRAVAAAHEWPAIAGFHVLAQDERVLIDVDPAAYGALAGRYAREGEGAPIHVTVEQGRLQLWLEGEWGRPEELNAESAARYVTWHGYTVEFPGPGALRLTDPWGDTVAARRAG